MRTQPRKSCTEVAKATTEMEQSGIEVRCKVADPAEKELYRGGESHERCIE